MKLFVGITFVIANSLSNVVLAAEHKFSGVIDVRMSQSTSLESFVQGGFGKFRFNDGNTASLAQAGLVYNIDWDSAFSAHIVANAYVDDVKDAIGLTEAYVRYDGLPNESGYKLMAKAGVMYPRISVENFATAWSSPNTLSYSTLNSWVGEELRNSGVAVTLAHLGKFTNSEHNFDLSVELFQHNDTTGAMLAWHGWTLSSRQTLLQETIPLGGIPALGEGGKLRFQALESDPFIELDDKIGHHISGRWQWRGKGSVLAGYYDNNADTSVVINGQYAWLTRFYHFGVKWRLPMSVQLTAQFMDGDTAMFTPSGSAVVDNKYKNAFVMFSKKWQRHQLNFRFEKFEIVDYDNVEGDNNTEDGNSVTLSYRYQYSKHWFFHLEHNWLDSFRPARYYIHAPRQLTEKQWQLAARYFF